MNDSEVPLPRDVEGTTRSSATPSPNGPPGQRRRRPSRRSALAAASVAAVVGGVSVGVHVFDDANPTAGTGVRPGASSPSRADPAYGYSNQPSPVVLRLSDRDAVLRPWTYCWDGPDDADGVSTIVCADGAPSKVAELVDAGHPNFIRFWFGMAHWDFEATFRQLGTRRTRSFTVDASPTSAHTYQLDPPGPAARYRVDISGRGEGGDVITSFVWTTTADGPLSNPPPASRSAPSTKKPRAT